MVLAMQELIKKHLISFKTVFFRPDLFDCGPYFDVETECSLDMAAAAIDTWRSPQLEFLENVPNPPYVKAQLNLSASCILTLHASEVGCSRLLRRSGLEVWPPKGERIVTEAPASTLYTNIASENEIVYLKYKRETAGNKFTDNPLFDGISRSKVWSNSPSPPRVWHQPLLQSKDVKLVGQLLQFEGTEDQKSKNNLFSTGRVMANLTQECNNRKVSPKCNQQNFRRSKKESHEFLTVLLDVDDDDYDVDDVDDVDDDELEHDKEQEENRIPLCKSYSSSLVEQMANCFVKQMGEHNDEASTKVNASDSKSKGTPTGFRSKNVALARNSLKDSKIPRGSSSICERSYRSRDYLGSIFLSDCSNITEVIKLGKREILQIIGPKGLDIEKISVQADCKIVLLPITNDMLVARGRDYESCHTFKLIGQPNQVARAKNLLRRALLEIRSK